MKVTKTRRLNPRSGKVENCIISEFKAGELKEVLQDDDRAYSEDDPNDLDWSKFEELQDEYYDMTDDNLDHKEEGGE